MTILVHKYEKLQPNIAHIETVAEVIINTHPHILRLLGIDYPPTTTARSLSISCSFAGSTMFATVIATSSSSKS